jgi:CRP-like cAMP-binding protein
MELNDILMKSRVFSNLNESVIVKLLMHTHYQLKKYVANEIIAYKSDECKAFLLVTSGSVRAEMTNIDGKVLKIEDIHAGNAIALGFLFGKNNRLPVNVVANSDTEILRIQKNDFLLLLQNNRIILENLLNLISERSQFLAGKLQFLNMKTIRGKYAFYLLQHLQEGKKSVVLPTTQEQLAELFGITRPSLSRVINELISEELIAIKGKSITILNINELVNYANL